jgi:hypothetical protein
MYLEVGLLPSLYLTGRETKAHRVKDTCPRSNSQSQGQYLKEAFFTDTKF